MHVILRDSKNADSSQIIKYILLTDRMWTYLQQVVLW